MRERKVLIYYYKNLRYYKRSLCKTCTSRINNLIIIKIKSDFYNYYNNLMNYIINKHFNYNDNYNL